MLLETTFVKISLVLGPIKTMEVVRTEIWDGMLLETTFVKISLVLGPIKTLEAVRTDMLGTGVTL